MNKFLLLTLLSLTAIGCVKHEVAKPEFKVPKVPKADPLVNKKAGYKCDIQGVDGSSKEIFIELNKNDKTTLFSLYDFIYKQKISILTGTFEGYRLYSVTLKEETLENGETILSGEGMITPNAQAEHQMDEKILLMTSRITLDEQLNGTLELKLLRSSEAGQAPEWTSFEQIAEISNCEKFDAVYL